MYSLRNDPQPLNDPQIDLEIVPISPHLDPEMIPNYFFEWNGILD